MISQIEFNDCFIVPGPGREIKLDTLNGKVLHEIVALVFDKSSNVIFAGQGWGDTKEKAWEMAVREAKKQILN